MAGCGSSHPNNKGEKMEEHEGMREHRKSDDFYREMAKDKREKSWGRGKVFLVRVVSDLENDAVHELIENSVLASDSAILEVEVEGIWE
jgi:hypothetical protein